MASKIFRSTLLVAVIALLCSVGIVMGVLYGHFSGVQVNQLRDELSLAVTGTEQYGNAFLENVESGRFRLTWIDADGRVLFDTQVDASSMANHADREEIREALESGSGSSFRYSDTLTQKTLYEAARLHDGTVLRISASQESAAALIVDMLPSVVLVTAAVTVLAAVLSRYVARTIVEPMNRLDLEKPLSNDTYEELTPILQRLNQQHLQIASQLETLKRKTDEFTQVTENMQEGLVLLGRAGEVLSINPTACGIFGVEGSCVGRSFLQVDRSQQMRNAVNDALDKGHGTMRGQYNGRYYQFDLSRIQSGTQVMGAALLAFDITASRNAEQLRREFSANVSHELKTPLQSIIGSAELLENGLVLPEDTPRFVGRIRKEADQLVRLVEDIIRLSQLDEDIQLPTETVDLMALVRETQQTLRHAAGEKQVTFTVEGTSCTLTGVKRLLQEIVSNLCDNAIKYNIPGGSVRVRVERIEDRPVLTVSDTGIGIPPEHRDRIFERFYRVDKSHSKASGGTGLGLSIVKHAAAYHKAQLEVESQPGKGTTIRVIF